MFWVCVMCVIVLICGVACFYAKTSAILNHIDEMIDQAIEGTLTENEFSEKKASRIEAKLYRFLHAGKMDKQQAVKERDSIKSLISDISHQTKTPVANILLYTQLLDERGALGEEEKKLLSRISSQTEKLDFLIQEFNRETNTIGSKAQELAITRMVVDMKAEIEKIREQIQNIE